MIRFEQVGKRYSNGHVGLHELSFRVRRGEFNSGQTILFWHTGGQVGYFA